MKALNYIDWIVILVSGSIAIVVSVLKMPLGLWLPAWTVQASAFIFAVSRQDRAHWPSTLFGCIAVAHIVAAMAFLASADVSLSSLLQLLFGLIFVHGFLYLVAAKPFLIRRGYIKPTTA